jgi:hypothetical protein
LANLIPVFSRYERDGVAIYSLPDLKKKSASTGKIIIVTNREIAKLEIIVTGIDLMYSPMIPETQKYNGTNTAIVVEVQKIKALP